MYYVILQKNLRTEYTSIHSVFEDKELAQEQFDHLINEVSDEDEIAFKLLPQVKSDELQIS